MWVPPWKETGPRLKVLSWCMALSNLEATTTFIGASNGIRSKGRRWYRNVRDNGAVIGPDDGLLAGDLLDGGMGDVAA
jgi:hypothetical protein